MDANFYYYKLRLHHVNYLCWCFCAKLTEKDKGILLNKNKLSRSILNLNIITKDHFGCFFKEHGPYFHRKNNNYVQFKNNSFRPNKCNKMMLENDSTA